MEWQDAWGGCRRRSRCALRRFDRAATYREARRILRPSGALTAWSYGSQEVRLQRVHLDLADQPGQCSLQLHNMLLL
jgi:hypothetical protein